MRCNTCGKPLDHNYRCQPCIMHRALVIAPSDWDDSVANANRLVRRIGAYDGYLREYGAGADVSSIVVILNQTA